MICGLLFLWTVTSMENFDVDNDDINFEIDSGEDTNNVTGMRERMALKKKIETAQARYDAMLIGQSFGLTSGMALKKDIATAQERYDATLMEKPVKLTSKPKEEKKKSTLTANIKSIFSTKKKEIKNYV